MSKSFIACTKNECKQGQDIYHNYPVNMDLCETFFKAKNSAIRFIMASGTSKSWNFDNDAERDRVFESLRGNLIYVTIEHKAPISGKR